MFFRTPIGAKGRGMGAWSSHGLALQALASVDVGEVLGGVYGTASCVFAPSLVVAKLKA